MCFRLCCDPHKLTYVSAIITIVEAVIFGAINLTLILMKSCVFIPPEELGAGLDKFWAWYFFDNQTCANRHPELDLPGWVDTDYPIEDRPDRTTVEANYHYQIAYLALHALWILSALVLIYGNARKRWGFYIPWLLIALTLLVMDVVLASFFIKDMVDIDSVSFSDGSTNEGPIIWMISLYLRGYLFWFSNLTQTATVINAFCKSRHKRVKQEQQREKQEKKHELEMSEATAAAAAAARAEAQAEAAQHQAGPSHAKPPTVQQVHVEHHHNGIENAAFVGAQEYPYAREHHNPYPPPYVPNRNPPPSRAPKEVRPFSYLNPEFRPNDPHDVMGMKRHAAPGLPDATKGQGYFTALPPRDYDDDDDVAPLPRINLGMGDGPYNPTAPRDNDYPPSYGQRQPAPPGYNPNPPYRSNNYY